VIRFRDFKLTGAPPLPRRVVRRRAGVAGGDNERAGPGDGAGVTCSGKDRGEPGQTYTGDASAEPARIDGTTAPPKGPRRVGPGVYKVEGDRLTLAVAAGADRPDGFSTSLADSTPVFVHKRADKQKD